MSKSAIIAMILTAALALPAFAGGGGGGRGGRGGGGGGGGFGGGGGGPGGGGFGGGPGGGGAGGGGFGGAGGNPGNPGGGGFTNGGGGGGRGNPNNNPGGFTGRTTNTPVVRGTGLTGGPMTLPLDGEFGVLRTTSIFAQNRRAVQTEREIIIEQPIVVGPPPAPPFRGDAPIFRGVVKDLTGDQAVVEMQEQDPATRQVISNPHSLKAGQALTWNGDAYNVVSVDVENREMVLEYGGQQEKLQIGFNILGQPMQQLSDVAPYQSADALRLSQPTQPQAGGRGGRGGRGGGGGAAAGGATGVYTNPGGGGAIGIGLTGGTGMAGLQGALVTTLDPQLPPGSADNLEARMRSRRDTQLSAPANVVTTPTGTGTITPSGTILPAPAPTPVQPAAGG